MHTGLSTGGRPTARRPLHHTLDPQPASSPTPTPQFTQLTHRHPTHPTHPTHPHQTQSHTTQHTIQHNTPLFTSIRLFPSPSFLCTLPPTHIRAPRLQRPGAPDSLRSRPPSSALCSSAFRPNPHPFDAPSLSPDSSPAPDPSHPRPHSAAHRRTLGSHCHRLTSTDRPIPPCSAPVSHLRSPPLAEAIMVSPPRRSLPTCVCSSHFSQRVIPPPFDRLPFPLSTT